MIISSCTGELGFMEDWDLQAVVRGSCNTSSSPSSSSTTVSGTTSSLFAPVSFEEDLAAVFPELFSSDVSFDEVLEGFYSNKPIITAQNTMIPKQELVETKQVASGEANLGAKPRRRKNQQKRVVQEVTEDGVCGDMWAWRKYGQKPIKGSPYPRSYYRCSSLKGCPARKQVERSSSDPSIFIITFTSEHTHPHPTRRNSLAGTTRAKPSLPKPDTPRIKEECSSPNPDVSTPISMASAEDNQFFLHSSMVKNEEEEHNGGIIRDLVFSDELFPCLEDFEGVFLDQFAEMMD